MCLCRWVGAEEGTCWCLDLELCSHCFAAAAAAGPMTDFLLLRQRCAWTPDPHGASLFMFEQQSNMDMDPSIRAPMNHGHPSDMPFRNSSYFYCKSARVRGVRVGPFVAMPGESSPMFAFHSGPGHNLNSLFEPGESTVGYVGHVIDSFGVPIGFPPLHMHHLHVERVHNAADYKSTWAHTNPRDNHGVNGKARGDFYPPFNTPGSNYHYFETHGDATDGLDYGLRAKSALSYERMMSPGFCIPFPTDPVRWQGKVNDVRTAGPRLYFFIEVAFMVHDKDIDGPCVPAFEFWFANPVSFHPKTDPSQYDVPNRAGMTWFSGVMGFNGRKVDQPTWIHVHHMRTIGVSLHAATPSELGLCKHEAELKLTDYGIYLPVEDTSLFEGLQEHPKLVCQTNLSRYTAIEVARAGWPAEYFSEYFDRQDKLACAASWSFRKGEPWTITAMHAPRWDTYKGHFSTHVNFFM
jgi:hypothetical protein